MTLLQTIATYAANEHFNFHCQQMDMPEKLLCWQRVYDTTLAALRFYHESLLDQRREALAYVSAN